MEFDYNSWVLNPFILIFASTLSGLLIGKIAFGRFKFGVSGALFSGLVLGKYAYDFASTLSIEDAGYEAARKVVDSGVASKDFFQLFLVIFVAAVGLLASKDMGAVIKKYGTRFIALGIVITFTGAVSTVGVAAIAGNENPYEMSGLYTGALTSSPGFAAAVETAGDKAYREAESYRDAPYGKKLMILERLDKSGNLTPENTTELSESQKMRLVEMAESGVGVGNAIAYPFGVLIVILAMNVLPAIFSIDMEEEKKIFAEEIQKLRKSSHGASVETKTFDLPAFALVCLVGYSIGKAGIPIGDLGVFSLGSTGGVLIGALILGNAGRIGPFHFRMDSGVLGVLRQVSLAFFLSVVGLRNGYAVFEALGESGIELAVSALFVGVASIFAGYIIGRYIFKINWIMLSGAICGGMTSTPGLGASIDATKSDDPAAGYGATYPFALVGMVLFTLILSRLSF